MVLFPCFTIRADMARILIKQKLAVTVRMHDHAREGTTLEDFFLQTVI